MTVQMNTVNKEKSGDFDLQGKNNFKTLTFGSGPYLSVDLKGASLTLDRVKSNGVEAKLIGDFAFEQSDGETIVVMDNVSSSVSINGSAGTLEKGRELCLLRLMEWRELLKEN